MNIFAVEEYNLKLPQELIDKMKKYADVPWDAIIRKIIQKYLTQLDITNKLAENSQLTEEDTIELGRMVNKSALSRFIKETYGE